MNRKQRRAEEKHGKPVLQAASPAVLGLLAEAVRHHQAGHLSEAERLYRQILRLDSRHADTLHLLGVLTHQLGRHDAAAEMIAKAIAQNGRVANFHVSLGNALLAQGMFAEAAASYGRALALKPDFAEAHRNLGTVLRRQGKLDAAIECYGRALTHKRDYAEAHGDLGDALQAQGKSDEAAESYKKALAHRPDWGEAHNNLGTVLRDRGEVDAAVLSYRQAIACKPDLAAAHNNLLMTLHYAAKASNATLLDAALCFGRTFDKPSPAFSAQDRNAERRLRIGYVSGDFRFHPAGFFLTRVFAAHDRDRVELFCYSNNTIADAMTDRLRSGADHWSNIAGLADADAASLIRRDGIDILIDLSGHTDKNRLLLFALHPAPVQVSWLGYFGTTGLAAMDYIVMDAATVPPGEERWYSEAMVRLPQGRFCYEAPEMAPPPADPPCRRRGAVTFGSFNNVAKIGPGVVRLWADILHAAPGSRLILKWTSLSNEGARRRLSDAFAKAGVVADRVELRGASPHIEALAEYGDIDIALDPFPFGGGLTSCEALWMGVPVVTLPGDLPASRQTLGFLRSIGLDDLIAASPADYIERALSLAADPQRLAALRHALRPRMAASPLCDGPLFTAALEKALREMWRRHCAGQPVAPFDVPRSEATSGQTRVPQLADP